MTKKLPMFEEQPGSVRTGIPQAPSTPYQAVDVSGVQKFLGGKLQQARKDLQERATEAVRQRASKAQHAAGPRNLAETGGDLPRRYRNIWREQTLTVLESQAKADSATRIAELRREYDNDPEGFNEAYRAYSQDYVASIQEVDEEAAFALERFFDVQRDQTYQRMLDEQFKRDKAAEKADSLNAVTEMVGVYGNELLNNPDEATYHDHLDATEAQLSELESQGLISRSELYDTLSATKIDLTTNYVRGEFNRALDRADLEAAQNIVESLTKRGDWFQDNERARIVGERLGRELQGILSAQQSGIRDQVTLMTTQLSRAYQGAKSGFFTDPEVFENHLEFIAQHGTLSQYLEAKKNYDSLVVLDTFQPTIEGSNLEDTITIMNIARSLSPLDVDPQAIKTITDAAQDRLDRFSEAYNSGDIAGASGIGIDRLLNFNIPTGAIRADVIRRKEETANFFGIDPRDVPAFSREDAKTFSSNYKMLVDDGDYAQASAYLQRGLEVAFGDQTPTPPELITWARGMGEAATPVYLQALLLTQGASREAMELPRVIASGGDVSPTEVEARVGRNPDLFFSKNKKLMQTARAWSMGDMNLQLGIERALKDTYAYWAVQTESNREAENKVWEYANLLGDVQELTNGRYILDAALGETPTERSQTRRAINRVLDDPVEYLHLAPGQAEESAYIQPYPMGEGTWGFMHDDGGLMTDDQGEPILIRDGELHSMTGARPSVFATGREFTQKAFVNRLEEAQRAATYVGDKIRGVQEITALREQLAIFGGDTESFVRIEDATSRMSTYDTSMTNHIGAYAVHADMIEFAKEKFPTSKDVAEFVKRNLPEEYVNFTGRDGVLKLPKKYLNPYDSDANRMLGILYFNHVDKKYNTPEEKYAAYFMGVDNFEDFRSTFPDNWFNELPLHVSEFVKKASADRTGRTLLNLKLEGLTYTLPGE